MKLFGWPWHVAIPMIALVGIVGALDVAVWKLKPLDTAQYNEQNYNGDGLPQPSAAPSVGNSPPQHGVLNNYLSKLQSDPIVLLTIVLMFVAVMQTRIYREQLSANKTIERAYLTMNRHWPGLVIDELVHEFNGPPSQHARVIVRIRNRGNTPALATFTLLQYHFGPLPTIPPYDETNGQAMNASVGKKGKFVHLAHWTIPTEMILRMKLGGEKLFVFGYADYIDRFNERHRVGWAMEYDRLIDIPGMYRDGKLPKKRSNLRFITTPGYNYDRKRQKGEGNDWDEPHK